nr:hypothetical protein [Tanacetum cinerariifolium]
MIYHYKLGLAQVESRLVEHKDREIKYCEKIRGLEYKTESSDEYIEILKKKLVLIKKEKESLDGKLAGFQTASKDLDSLLESQRLDKNKEGLGYSTVPLPPAQIYSSPKNDMSWTGLPEFKDDTVTDYSRPAPTVENSPTVVKTKKKETVRKPSIKYAELYRKPSKKSTVKGNQRNWNNLKSQHLGIPTASYGVPTARLPVKKREDTAVKDCTATKVKKKLSVKVVDPRKGTSSSPGKALYSGNLIADGASSLEEDCYE